MTPPRLTEASLRRAGLGAFFRPRELGRLGISPDELRTLVASGVAERVSRGLYQLAGVEPTEQHTLAAACAAVPQAIVCLLSALKVHGIGTRLPAELWLGIPHKARAPQMPHTRVRFVRFSGRAVSYGIEPIRFEGVPARITNPARTVVDCFRFERLVGREACIEALRDALRGRKVSTDALYRTLDVLPSRRLAAALEVTGA